MKSLLEYCVHVVLTRRPSIVFQPSYTVRQWYSCSTAGSSGQRSRQSTVGDWHSVDDQSPPQICASGKRCLVLQAENINIPLALCEYDCTSLEKWVYQVDGGCCISVKNSPAPQKNSNRSVIPQPISRQQNMALLWGGKQNILGLQIHKYLLSFTNNCEFTSVSHTCVSDIKGLHTSHINTKMETATNRM